MYTTPDQARELPCWKTIGTDNEYNCYAPKCHAWLDLVDVQCMDRCPHCHKKITGADMLGDLVEHPIGYCGAVFKR